MDCVTRISAGPLDFQSVVFSIEFSGTVRQSFYRNMPVGDAILHLRRMADDMERLSNFDKHSPQHVASYSSTANPHRTYSGRGEQVVYMRRCGVSHEELLQEQANRLVRLGGWEQKEAYDYCVQLERKGYDVKEDVDRIL